MPATMEANCKCLQRRNGCLNKCPVSRESRLHERVCESCGKNPEAKREDVLARRRISGNKEVRHGQGKTVPQMGRRQV